MKPLVGTEYQQAGPQIAACSMRNDLAIVLQIMAGGTVSDVYVVQLSAGRLIHHFTYPANSACPRPNDVLASPGGRYIAERDHCVRGTRILDASTGGVVTELSAA